ncbi:MAG: iron-siderophore ABC transporter substrate-binding protein [Paracoccus sp. (in: a-proteobacteria)]
MVGIGAALRRPDRRRFLTAASFALAAGLCARQAGGQGRRQGLRLAAIDWAMMETAIAIDHMPVAVTELIRLREDVPQGIIADDIIDLGLRGAPNFELLQLARPDLILTSPYYTWYEERLRGIAPVLSLPFFLPGEPPLPKALDALNRLAAAVVDPDAGRTARIRVEAELSRHARSVARFRERPFCLVEIGDARHLRSFGSDSLYGSTLDRIGLQNAWGGKTEFSFLAPVPIERLAEIPAAILVVAGPVPPQARRSLSRSVLWQRLPAVAENRIYQLPRLNAFGGVLSALAFAAALEGALFQGPVADLA